VEYLEFAIELARAGGEVLKHYMSREKRVELKGRANLVTIADKESEALIIRRIQERYPRHAILAEESGASERQKRPRVSGSSIRSMAPRTLRTNTPSLPYRLPLNRPAGSFAAPCTIPGVTKCSAALVSADRS
jgi:hypothetical protein